MNVSIDDIMKNHKIVDTDFNNLSKLDFSGVYIIYDPDNNDEVVYVGSAYSRTIKERLEQYKRKNDTGNTLLHEICKKDYGKAKVKDIGSDDRKKAIDMIMHFKIKAIQHNDLEYQLIKEANPKYNTVGNDATTDDYK